LDEVQAAADLEEAVKTELTSRWTEVVETLRSGANFNTQAAEHQTRLDQIPQRTEELQASMAAPPSEPPAESYADADLVQLEQELAMETAALEETRKQLAELEAEPARRAARRRA